MTYPDYTAAEQSFLNELELHGILHMLQPSARERGGVNVTMPSMLRSLVEGFEPQVQWMNEEDPESMIEVVLFPSDDAPTFEDGIRLAEYVNVLFTDWCEFQGVGDNHARLLFDNPNELGPGDRITFTETGRTGAVDAPTEREDEDEPRSLRVLVNWDDSTETSWVYRYEVEGPHDA